MFKNTDPNHEKYAPVAKWVKLKDGKFIIGGTTYKNELSRLNSILGILTEFARLGKIVRMEDKAVDLAVLDVQKIESSPNFDDPHLVALVRVSGCRLICVHDPRSHKYLRDGRFYNSLRNRPSLYTRPKNQHLLCSNNITNCCR